MEEIRLNDISDDLLILNKITVDRLFQLENCVDCIALYMFYYKTAKWQKTNTIKANDVYVRKCLGWGSSKVTRIKNILKQEGLIDIVQRRQGKQITGWYVQVNYITNKRGIDEIKVKVDNYNNTPGQELQNTTSSNGETNALKEYIKCLENKIEVLTKEKKTKKKTNFIPPTLEEVKQYCLSRGNKVDPEYFYNFFNEGGWKDSNGKEVKNWKQKIITWESYSNNSKPNTYNNNSVNLVEIDNGGFRLKV